MFPNTLIQNTKVSHVTLDFPFRNGLVMITTKSIFICFITINFNSERPNCSLGWDHTFIHSTITISQQFSIVPGVHMKKMFNTSAQRKRNWGCTRKVAYSINWARRADMSRIIKRGFWASVHPFLNNYLTPGYNGYTLYTEALTAVCGKSDCLNTPFVSQSFHYILGNCNHKYTFYYLVFPYLSFI